MIMDVEIAYRSINFKGMGDQRQTTNISNQVKQQL